MTLKQFEAERAEIYNEYNEKVAKLHSNLDSQLSRASCYDPNNFDEIIQQYDDALLTTTDWFQQRVSGLARKFMCE